MEKTALIFGVTGQDGTYLSRLLLDKGYRVIGTSRNATRIGADAPDGISPGFIRASVRLNDFRSVTAVVEEYMPDEIYNLAGQSSVAVSFDQPIETLQSVAFGTLNILEAIRGLGKSIRFYNAGSSECFGDTVTPAHETSSLRPRSPYGVAKAAAFWNIENYREGYDLFACTGILFSHESPLRSERFVTKKIVAAAARIARGSDEKLSLGNLSIQRDWGWAPEYVEAMWMMLQREHPENFVVATGRTYTLQSFVQHAFAHFDLDWHDHVLTNAALFRPSDIAVSRADPAKANEVLGWKAASAMPEVVKMLALAETGGNRVPSSISLPSQSQREFGPLP